MYPFLGRNLIAKVYEVDPLLYTRRGKRISLIAFVTDQVAITKILDHLGLSTPEAENPPPPVPAGACRRSGIQPEELIASRDRARL